MIDTGNHAWILVSSAFVIFMTPGLAFFYGGMVRSKNVLGMLMMNFFSLGLTTVLWVTFVFSLAFSGDGNWIGNFDLAFLEGMTDPAGGNGDLLFMIFQATFAIITVALITGAVADRIKFSAWAWFMGLWIVLVYAPVAKWVFGGGWLADRGALDFAGGAVVHINAGAAAIAAVLILGKRKGWPQMQMAPHNLPWTLLGAAILWFGWFGFNAGSAGAADGIAVQAFVNTQVAAGTAMLAWLVAEKIKTGHATTLGAASGLVAGLVAITPAAGFVGGMAPIAIGAAAGVLCFLAIDLKVRLGYDDSLDVVGVHLVGGLVGSILLGLFADTLANPDGADGWLFGGGSELFVEQIIASAAVLVYSFVVSAIIMLVLKTVLPQGIRVTDEEEDEGLDLSQHAESAYSFGELGSMARE